MAEIRIENASVEHFCNSCQFQCMVGYSEMKCIHFFKN